MHTAWDNIAETWNSFRSLPIREAKEFLLGRKGMVLDIGCGSGRNFLSGMTVIGVDSSYKMLLHAKENAAKKGVKAYLIRADAAALPLKPAFDRILLVAVLHALKERKACISEVRRLLGAGGKVLVSVWNRDQPKFKDTAKETEVPWKAGGKEYYRYTYLFTREELASFLKENGFDAEIIESGKKAFNPFSKNIVAVLKRGSPSGQWD